MLKTSSRIPSRLHEAFQILSYFRPILLAASLTRISQPNHHRGHLYHFIWARDRRARVPDPATSRPLCVVHVQLHWARSLFVPLHPPCFLETPGLIFDSLHLRWNNHACLFLELRGISAGCYCWSCRCWIRGPRIPPSDRTPIEYARGGRWMGS